MSDHSKLKITDMNYDKSRLKAENPVKIQDVTFRDGQQSLFDARMRTEDMIPVAEMMDETGFWALEMWGGATFESMHRFLNEDPWERIRTLKRYIKKTPFSMLLSGQNLVGNRNYPDDVARAFVDKTIENGIDIFRIFDALDDYRNFETVISVIKQCGKHFQGCICYSMTEHRMGGDVYTLEYYIRKAKELEQMGADSICINDEAGLLAPYDAYALVKALKNSVSAPIHLHSHFTSGLAAMTQLEAIEAGVDIVDTCMSPYAYRNSHPAIEPLIVTLLGTNRDTGFDIKHLTAISKILENDIIPKYRHLLNDSKVSPIDTNVLLHQASEGMISDIVNQLKEMDSADKLEQVYAELPKVRKDLGQIPLVTPTSKIVGIQTVNNVLFDDENERYKMITEQVQNLCYGLYGKTAVPINSKIQKKALKHYSKGNKPIKCRPCEILESELEKVHKDVEGLASNLEDELIYAIYPKTGKKFLKWKYGKEAPPPHTKPKTMEQVKAEQEFIAKAKEGKLIEKIEKKVHKKGANARLFNVFVDGEYFEVEVEEPDGQPVINYVQPMPAPSSAQISTQQITQAPTIVAPQKTEKPKPKPISDDKPTSIAKSEQSRNGATLVAPMPGLIIKYEKQIGDSVNKGDIIVILEAMKMENALPSPASGTIKTINYKSGDSVAKGDVLCLID